MLCSKMYKELPFSLAEEVARLARRICIKQVEFDSISALVSCRLIPLMKEDDGIRPIGIGEVLRRIVGKSVSKVLNEDIQNACGSIQTCSGLQSGIDAAVHAMREVYDADWCEGVLLVDAENAFNRLNRQTSLQTIRTLCPSLFRYLMNTYQSESNLYLEDGSTIMSSEGVTQGDNIAMAMYGISVRPLM